MKKTFLFILSITLMGMFSVMAQTVVPTTSTDGAETWYYMKLVPRDAANPQNTWATVMPDDTLKTIAYTGGDEQLWKVVENGAGLALVNKLDGRYMDLDYSMNRESLTTPGTFRSSRVAVTATMPQNTLRFVESTGYDFSGLSPETVPGWTPESKAVFVVDNEVTEVAGDNTFTFKTTGGAPFSFVLTSYGAPSWGPLSIPTWGNGNHNQLVQFRTKEEVSVDLKIVLAASITKANTTLGKATVGEDLGEISSELQARLQSGIDNAQVVHDDVNSTVEAINLAMQELNGLFGFYKNIETANTLLKTTSIGYNPGQFTQEVVDGLVSIVDYAQEVASDAGSTKEDMDDATLELLAIISAFTDQVNLPELSTAIDNWYYIQGTRPANSYLTAGEAGAGTQVKSLNVIPDDTQLWKLVSNGDGFALQNKASGEYIQADETTVSNTTLATQAEMPTLPLMFKGSTQTTNNTLRFLIENVEGYEPAYRFHAGGAGHNWGLMTWTGDANDNSSWLFLSEDELYRSEFLLALDAAKAVYKASVEGVEFGQYSAESRATLKTAIDEEEAKDILEMSQEELTAASVALKATVEAFECNSDVATLASFTETKWFRIVNNMQPETGYASNKAMSSNGRVVEQKFTFEEIDEDSDEQLFRFELNADKTAVTAIINKGDSLSYYVGVDGMILTEDPAVTFEITSLDAISFWIKPTDAAPLHAAAAGSNILNWNSGAGSASAWRILFVDSEPVTDFITPFQKALANAYTLFEAAAQLQGNKIGQYTEASVQAFSDVITQQEVKDPETMTKEELIAAIEALNAGPDLLSVNSDIKTLVTSDPATHWKWFRLINNQTSGYAAGMAMSSNGRLEEEPFTYEEKDEYSDAQLFRFELNAAETHVASIYNKASELYVDANGKLAAVSTEDNEFEIVQLAEGRSFWIHPTLEALVEESDPEEFLRLAPLHAASAGVHIVNWESGVGSASAWVFEYVETEYLSGLSSLDESKYTVRVNQGVVTVDGVENFEVYSTTGQRQNHKAALNPGVYVIKVENMTKKLVIK